jgi:hypothetical protein
MAGSFLFAIFSSDLGGCCGWFSSTNRAHDKLPSQNTAFYQAQLWKEIFAVENFVLKAYYCRKCDFMELPRKEKCAYQPSPLRRNPRAIRTG